MVLGFPQRMIQAHAGHSFENSMWLHDCMFVAVEPTATARDFSFQSRE
jgi:hypothetical protein